MRMKYLIVALLAVALVAGFGIAQACADGGCMGKKGGYDDKIHEKAMMILANEDELGLTEDQVKNIKDLKHKTMKDMIKIDADIDVLAIDLKSAMYEDPMDVAAVNMLIDSKYDLEKQKAKAVVAACEELRNILTAEQKQKMKAIMKEQKKMMMKMSCPMMGGGKGMMMKGMGGSEKSEMHEMGPKT